MTDEKPTLVIGTKAWSSWSLRPWFVMRHFGLAFDEIEIALRTPQTAEAIARHSPTGKIPVLIVGGFPICDSLAIIETLADQNPDTAIWPADWRARAVARSVSAEMHAGFQALRQNCPMDFNARGLAPTDSHAIATDVARIVALWQNCRTHFGDGGPFLFGDVTAADAMFAPVVSRFVTYDIDPSSYGDRNRACDPYIAAMMELPVMKAWSTAAIQHG
jgi:glutathione S-transferase